MMIGLISDTHGLLRPEAVEVLRGSELIIHAGDVGRPEILEDLRAIAPVLAVRGNIDQGGWADRLPVTAMAEVEAVRVYVIHDVKELDLDPVASGFRVVVSGHSHKHGQMERGGVLYVNPGSAGPRRFRLPITVARLHLHGPQKPRVEFVELTPGYFRPKTKPTRTSI
jgi:putative phosphoesterase